MNAPSELLKAAMDRFPDDTPVLHWPNGDRTQEPRVDVIAVRPYPSTDGVFMVRLMSRYQYVPVDHIERHQLAEEIGLLPTIEVREIEYPPPPCARCDVDTSHDGDCHVCPMCDARWSQPYTGVYPCVECGDRDADVEGADGQPRCRLCETEVRANLIDPTEPYRCKSCGIEVHGIGMHTSSAAYRARKCGMCQHSAEQREWLDSYRATAGAS